MDWLYERLYEYEKIIDVLLGSISLLTIFVVIVLNYRANQMAKRAILETKLIRELENRPSVYFHVLIAEQGDVLNFELVNQGNGIARKVQVVFDQELTVTRRREKVSHKEMAIFKTHSFLAPQGSFKEFVDLARVFFQDNKDTEEVTGKIEYEDAGGKKYFTPLSINLKAVGGRRFLVKPGLNKIMYSLEQIHRTIQRKRR